MAKLLLNKSLRSTLLKIKLQSIHECDLKFPRVLSKAENMNSELLVKMKLVSLNTKLLLLSWLNIHSKFPKHQVLQSFWLTILPENLCHSNGMPQKMTVDLLFWVTGLNKR